MKIYNRKEKVTNILNLNFSASAIDRYVSSIYILNCNFLRKLEKVTIKYIYREIKLSIYIEDINILNCNKYLIS